MKLQRAIDEVKKLLVVVSYNLQIQEYWSEICTFQTEGEDELKKRQLMELAIMNGTYRDSQSKNSSREYSIACLLLIHLELQYPSLFDEFMS